MKIKNCRICNSKQLTELFSLGILCFTGKFPTINQKRPFLDPLAEEMLMTLEKNCIRHRIKLFNIKSFIII